MNPRERIEAERRRQIEVEGWSHQHDDQHTDGSLYKAALAYLAFDPSKHNPNIAPAGWPASWDDMWWKPRTRQENLIRAGALCLAELERLARGHALRTAAKERLKLAQTRRLRGTKQQAGPTQAPRITAVANTLTLITVLLDEMSVAETEVEP